MEIILITLVVNFIISLIVAQLGTERKIGFWTVFWYSFLLSPIIGIAFAFNSDKIVMTESQTILDKNISEDDDIEFTKVDNEIVYRKSNKLYYTTDDKDFEVYSEARFHQDNIKNR